MTFAFSHFFLNTCMLFLTGAASPIWSTEREITASETLRLRETCPRSKYFWSVISPNAGKCGPEKLRIRTLFTKCEVKFVVCSAMFDR